MPDGLKGEEIPVEARIVAAADALDAMTSDRPYRPCEMSIDAVIEEIVRNSETQFDPDVVRAVVECFERGDLQLVPRTDTYPIAVRA